jgi:hypothetical protein
MTIHLPPEISTPLAAEADRLGTTPELLAVEAVRRSLPQPAADRQDAKNLREYLQGRLRPVRGSSEAFSQDCGKRFADGLAADRAAADRAANP